MSVPFRTAPFKTTGGTHARSTSDWFSDVVNVKEMGATGDGATDDAAAIQAALNRGFGTPGAPNGLDNSRLNKPVYFPTGNYKIAAPLDVSKVVGGLIYGDSKFSSKIIMDAPEAPGGSDPWPIFNINGAAGLTMQRLQLTHSGLGGVYTGTKACCINLNWDGDTSGNDCDGLHHNYFSEMLVGGGEWGVLIARDDEGGNNNMFVNVSVANALYGYQVEGVAATDNALFGGGVSGCQFAAVHCPAGGGSLHAEAWSFGGYDPGDDLCVDFRLHSNQIHRIGSGRYETSQFLDMSDGIAILNGVTNGLGGVVFANITGGKCMIEGCNLGTAGQITGTGGELYISGVYAPATTPLSGYSGTVKFNPQGLT